jgi:hypothetical protein
LSKYDASFPKLPFTLEDKINVINETFNANTIDEIISRLKQISNNDGHKDSKWAAAQV